MKRWGIFAFFSFLMAMCIMRAVDDEGAGGGDDILDKDLDDDAEGDKKDTDKKPDGDKAPDAKPPAKDENASLLEEIRQERALNSIAKEKKAQYGDGFDIDKIVGKLKEMEAKEVGSGSKLFNKAGIELMHLKHFANPNSDNEFDGSSGRGGKALSTDELVSKLNKGEASDEERKAFYAQYA